MGGDEKMKMITGNSVLADRLGIPSNLTWGYLGVLFFMIGDGLEHGWLSPYLLEKGLTMEQSAFLLTLYGIMLAISSWISGVFVQAWGPRKAMSIGLLFFITGTIGFVGWAIPHNDYVAMLPFYALRGLGYPLFSYSFLVWVTYRSPKQKLATAIGWFWVAFTGGLNVSGAFYSSYMIPKIGEINTLWTALIFVTIGGICAIYVNKDKFEGQHTAGNKTKELLKGFTIMFHNPKVALGGLVRTICTTASFGFVVFMPTYLSEFGFSLSEWLQIYATLFIVNIIFNLIFGVVGDKIGWRQTCKWFGGVLCGISTLAIYYLPQFAGHNYWGMMLVGCAFGIGLAGYVPIHALVASLEPHNKGAALSVVNLGAGLSAFLGPAIVGVFIGSIGTGGVMWIFAILYFAGAAITDYLKVPEAKAEQRKLKKAV